MRRKIRLQAQVTSLEERRVILSLYKSLLRLAGRFDKEPAAKTMLYRSQRPLSRAYSEEVLSEGDRYYGRALEKIFHSAILLTPDKASQSFSDFIKHQFRKEDEVNAASKIQCAFRTIRSFSSVWSMYSKYSIPNAIPQHAVNPRPARVPRILTDDLCPGVVLAAHPMVHGPLSRAVILLLQHDADGSYGVVINHRSHRTLFEVVKNLPDNVTSIFGSNPTHYGGPVKRLQCIHNLSSLEGKEIPLTSATEHFKLFSGGVTDSNIQELSMQLVDGQIPKEVRDSFNFFTGCCTWNYRELEDQIEEGFWMPMILSSEDVWRLIQQIKPEKNIVSNKSTANHDGKSSEKLIVQEPLVMTKEINQDKVGSIEAETADMYVTPGGRVRNNGWSWLMAIAGPPHNAISRIPFSLDVEDVDAVY